MRKGSGYRSALANIDLHRTTTTLDLAKMPTRWESKRGRWDHQHLIGWRLWLSLLQLHSQSRVWRVRGPYSLSFSRPFSLTLSLPAPFTVVALFSFSSLCHFASLSRRVSFYVPGARIDRIRKMNVRQMPEINQPLATRHESNNRVRSPELEIW